MQSVIPFSCLLSYSMSRHQELGSQQVIYLKSDDKVQALVTTIFVTLKGRLADLFKINVLSRARWAPAGEIES